MEDLKLQLACVCDIEMIVLSILLARSCGDPYDDQMTYLGSSWLITTVYLCLIATDSQK